MTSRGAGRSRGPDLLLTQPAQFTGYGDAFAAALAQLVRERAVRLDEEHQQVRPREHPVRRHRGHDQRHTAMTHARGIHHGRLVERLS
jgi:hypothetical protein